MSALWPYLKKEELTMPESSGDRISAASLRREDRPSPPVEFILEALCGLQFGEVRIIVQDGVVVQVDRTEKVRLSR